MAKQNYTTISQDELTKRIEDARRDLQKKTFQLRAHQLKQVRQIRHIRKEIARLLTNLRSNA